MRLEMSDSTPRHWVRIGIFWRRLVDPIYKVLTVLFDV